MGLSAYRVEYKNLELGIDATPGEIFDVVEKVIRPSDDVASIYYVDKGNIDEPKDELTFKEKRILKALMQKAEEGAFDMVFV